MGICNLTGAFCCTRSWPGSIFFDQSIEQIEGAIQQRLVPFAEEANVLESLPAPLQIGAAVVIAEMGTDRSRFPTARHLGVAPDPS
jgi:hypothetical protein